MIKHKTFLLLLFMKCIISVNGQGEENIEQPRFDQEDSNTETLGLNENNETLQIQTIENETIPLPDMSIIYNWQKNR